MTLKGQIFLAPFREGTCAPRGGQVRSLNGTATGIQTGLSGVRSAKSGIFALRQFMSGSMKALYICLSRSVGQAFAAAE